MRIFVDWLYSRQGFSGFGYVESKIVLLAV